MEDHSDEIAAEGVLLPAFEDEDVVVVFSANDPYVPFLSCVLQSVKDHASPDRTYDIVVLNTFFTKLNRSMLVQQMAADNISLRFFDFGPAISRFDSLRVYGHFRVETYYRLLIPEILPWCSKALYLDADMVVLRDVADLFDTDVEGYIVAATHDADTAGQYNGFDPSRKEFMDRELGLPDPYGYFQAGVVLFNLDEFRARYTSEEMLHVAASRQWPLLDQDVLNHLAAGHVRYVDMAWNVLMDWQRVRQKYIIGLAPEELREAYAQARKNPYIIHYAGPGNKPWECKKVDMGDYFWEYADRCPYADQIHGFLDEVQGSFSGRRHQAADFWVYNVMLRLSSRLAPANSPQRIWGHKVYKRFGGRF